MGKVNIKTVVYKKGDLIFAKLKGSPYWPARIEATPKDLIVKKKYNIMFYGTYETSVCKVETLEPYNEETKATYGQPKKLKGWSEGLWEIEHDPQLKRTRQGKTTTQELIREEAKQQQQMEIVSGEDGESGVNEQQEVKSPSTCKSENSSELVNEEDLNDLSGEEFKSLESKKTTRKPNRIQPKDDEQKDSSSVKAAVVKNVSPKVKQEIDESSNDSTQRPTRRSVRASSRKDDQSNDSNEPFKVAENSPDLEDSNFNEGSKRLSARNSRQIATDDEQGQAKSASKKSINKQKKITTKEQTNDLKRDRSSDENKNDSIDPKMDIDENLSEQTSVEMPPKAEIKTDESYTTKMNVTTENETVIGGSTEICSQIDTVKNNDICNKLPVLSDPKILEDKRQKWKNMTPEERLTEKAALKAKKNLEKKKSFIKSIQIQDALLRMNNQIKISLTVAHQDVERCCFIMEDLLKLPFKQRHLFNTPEIIETIRKVTKYKDQKVKNLASECFNKFRYMFLVNQSETFTSMFEKEREKFLAENVEDLKKERAIASQLAEFLSNSNKRKAACAKGNLDVNHEAKRLKTHKSFA